MKQYRVRLLLVIMIAALALAACSQTSQAQQPEQTPVRVQLAWVPTIEYSPFYIAIQDGLYAEQGIQPEFVNGGFDANGNVIDEIDSVINGNADFGLTTADSLLVARSQGVPIVAVATLYQRNPLAFISLAELNITTPQDFIGRKVVVDQNTGSAGIAYAAMMAELGIDRSQIEEIPRDDFTTEPLTSGRVEVISAFINNQPVQLRQQGYDINVILASDYGVETYANVIFTTEDMIANHPDVVERFLRASLNGIQAAISDPQHAVEVTVAQSDDLVTASEALSMEQATPLFKPAGTEVGMMQASVWNYLAETMAEQGLLTADTNVSQAYTLEFLNRIYGSN